MNWIVEPAERAWLPVSGRPERFAIHRVYCVGQNYADHSREMGGDPDREPPFFFCKPADAVVPEPERIPYPPRTSSLHHEVELVAALGRGGSGIKESEAAGYVYGLAVGIDLTRRDLQSEARLRGRPWDTAKAFDSSAPVGPLKPVNGVLPRSAAIWLKVNGAIRQSSDIERMIWSVPAIIAELSTLFRLRPGDLVFTGTPAGVGPVEPGERVECGIDGIGTLNFDIG